MIAPVQVGQRYTGWGKTWRVAQVWAAQGVAKIVNVADPLNTMRLPLTQFVTLARIDEMEGKR